MPGRPNLVRLEPPVTLCGPHRMHLNLKAAHHLTEFCINSRVRPLNEQVSPPGYNFPISLVPTIAGNPWNCHLLMVAHCTVSDCI